MIWKLLLLSLLTFLEVDFHVPGPSERLEAIGDTKDLPEALRRAFDPGDDFEPIPKPGGDDWLAVHEEKGQTYDDFRKTRRNIPRGTRSKVYFLPLGDFPAGRGPTLEKLKEFASAFFALEVKFLPAEKIGKDSFSPRENPYTGQRQILTGDILDFLKKKLPDDAFCLLAITLEDLYPEPSWNFVFGQASLRGRVGVYSFVRYDPAFYGKKGEKDAEKLILRRSLQVLAHETGHMFALLHCIHFNCLMNGSNYLEEGDRRPLHLCPVCLRKLQSSVDFDVVERYKKLLDFYGKAGLDEEAKWHKKRIEWIERGGTKKEK